MFKLKKHMKKFKAVFLFEFKRVFTLKHCLVFLGFFSLVLYMTYSGVSRYDYFLREKESFADYETLKVRQYINYEQYGAYGFRVLVQPSPLIVFRHSSLVFLQSTVDTKEVVDICSTYKGQKLFTHNEVSVDFSTVFQVLGTLLMLYFGLGTFVSIQSIRFQHSRDYIFNTICTRWFLLTGYFCVVIFSSFYMAEALGLTFSSKEVETFFNFSLYLLLFLTLFYLLGVLAAVLGGFRRRFLISAYLIWFLLIFTAPQFHRIDLEKRADKIISNEIVNMKKLKNSRTYEAGTRAYFKALQEKRVKEIRPIARRLIDEYINKILPLNTRIETDLNREVNRLISLHENRSVIFPSAFYSFSGRESSSMGYYGFQEFLSYVLALKQKFYHFYADRRGNRIDQTVEPFIKSGENIFLSTGKLPENFRVGVILILLYILLTLCGALYGLYRKLKGSRVKDMIEIDTRRMENWETYFYLARNREQALGILNYLRSEGAVIIDRPSPSHYDPGISLKSWIEFEIKQLNIDANRVNEILDTLEISVIHLNQKIRNLGCEVFDRAYLALRMAQRSDIYVFDDFLNRASKEMEQAFKEVLDRHRSHATIIYIGSQMYDIKMKERPQPPEGDFRFVAVDFNDITLR
jgi:hypothetical protein